MGHFGIIELALLNSNQDPNDSSVHHCNFIRYLFRFLQCLFKCLFLFRFLKKKNPNNKYFLFPVQNMTIWKAVSKGRPESYFNILWTVQGEKKNSYHLLTNSTHHFLIFLLQHLNHCVMYCTIQSIEVEDKKVTEYKPSSKFYKRYEYTDPFKILLLP